MRRSTVGCEPLGARRAGARAFVAALLLVCAVCVGCFGPYEQTYLGTGDNWRFRHDYPSADRLFNAFDYGHATLYEHLLHDPAGAAAALEGPEFDRVTRGVLRHPPSVPLDEHAIAPRYATLVPELEATFGWAHMLHRQLYDVLADRRATDAERDARVRALLTYYRSRRDLALSDAPKSMELMEGQRFSLAFRRQDPKFNGLLWSYHWLQMVVYDDLMASAERASASSAIDASVAHFWAMADSAPARTPRVMPMSAAVAPRFSERYPEAAIIFDNLHSLHDVTADIFASPAVAPHDKRAAILRALRQYQDSTTQVTSRDAWREMALEMGAAQMGGVAAPAKRPR